MHPNEQLLTKLFQAINAHKDQDIADCYSNVQKTYFQDIAFKLHSKAQIHAMWDMICSSNDKGESDLKVSVQELTANDSTARAVTLFDYTFRDTGLPVHNKITSQFEFKDGLIFKQKDDCDPVCWANQAFGGINGFIAGHVEFIRRSKAMSKLRKERPQAFQ
ncbi:MAG: nuclear transport factor 2 family protein [Methylosarcina sp.]